jgi:hypothetical protein
MLHLDFDPVLWHEADWNRCSWQGSSSYQPTYNKDKRFMVGYDAPIPEFIFFLKRL